MGQREDTRAADADMHEAFMDAGFGEVGSYRAPGAAEYVPVRVLVRYGTQVLGEFQQIVGYRDEVDFLLADVTPQARGTLQVDGQTLTLTDKVREDESASRWVVRRG